MDTINWYEIASFKMNIYQAIVKRIDNSPVTISPIVYGLKNFDGSPVDAMKWGIWPNGIVYKKPWGTVTEDDGIRVTATYDGLTLEQDITVEILPEPLIIKPSANIQPIYENSGKDQLIYTAVAEWEGGESLSLTHGSVESSDATFSLGPDSDPAISIDPDSGKVRLTIDPDYETKNLYFFSVKATLQGLDTVLESIPYSLSLDILNDDSETADSDNDGVGDDEDAFPDDATETVDTDGDGVGDNADAFPDDATETADADNDGVGDIADAFPDDATETADSDNDGVGDIADVNPDVASVQTCAHQEDYWLDAGCACGGGAGGENDIGSTAWCDAQKDLWTAAGCGAQCPAQ
jgi:hypothetical protein